MTKMMSLILIMEEIEKEDIDEEYRYASVDEENKIVLE